MIEASAPWPGHWSPLGVTADDDGVNVALWADQAERVEICLFDSDGREERYGLEEQTYHVWHRYLPGVRAGQRYGFRVHGPWNPANGDRFNPSKLLTDPYAKAIDGRLVYEAPVYGHVFGGSLDERDQRDSAPFVPRSVVVRDHFDWGTDHPPRIPWSDTVVYEAHVRGLTMRHPDVPAHQRGTYAGLAHPSVVNHLSWLGVTAVELLPVHHFTTEEHLARSGRVNYWGYNSLGYFAPEATYSSTGSLGGQVSEFKAMVKTLHEAGLEVILDVVYNHTAEGGAEGPTLSFRGIGNGSYYKLSDDRRHYADYTGCGNTLDLSHPHVLQLVMDSLRYWVQEMHVDGFRFDLASALARSLHDVDMLSSFLTTIQQDPVLSQVKLIAEPWDVGAGGYQVGEFPPLWSEWNDQYRDTVRDFWRGQVDGVRGVAARLSGSADLYGDDGRRPLSSINFVTAHDGFTLRDLVTYNDKHNWDNGEESRDGTDNNRSWNHGVEGESADAEVQAERRRALRSLIATLALSMGVPMFTAGDEMGRTQGGNNNAYCQDSETSWVDWSLAPWQVDLLEFTRMVLGIRKAHPALRHRHFLEGRSSVEGGPKDLAWFTPEGQELADHDWWDGSSRTLGMYVDGASMRARTPWGQPVVDSSFLLVLHGGEASAQWRLPGAPWASSYRLLLDTSDEQPGPSEHFYEPGAILTLRSGSAVLLEAHKE